MVKKVRSARGVEVNFDALKIKEQLADSPAPMEVQAREDFVDQRLKRRARRQAQQAAAALALEQTQPEEQPSESTPEEPVVDTAAVEPIVEQPRKQKTKSKKK